MITQWALTFYHICIYYAFLIHDQNSMAVRYITETLILTWRELDDYFSG